MLKGFFHPTSVAVIGASRDTNKVGHIIFKNLIESFKGRVYPVNPNATEILNYRAYPSVLAIKEDVETAIIAVSSKVILKVVRECGKKGIKNLIIITSGFGEVGNYKLEKELFKLIKKYKMRCLGPNILGVFDAHSKFDCTFLPKERMKKPEAGDISFISQSGALGLSILDLVASEGYKFAKFVSYGNALDVDESDLLEYLGEDEQTKIICLYLEGVKDGKKFLEVSKKVVKKKPVIALKGGTTEVGGKAVLSHTGSLAGSAEIYRGVLKQAGIIQANSLREMFEFAKTLDKCIKPKGDRIQIITNGGGYGILCADEIEKEKLSLAKLSKKTVKKLKKVFPENVIVSNPMDLLGDVTTERYRIALESCIEDDNIDIILVVLLYQLPRLTRNIIDVLIEFNNLKKKPIVVVSTGGELTDFVRRKLEENGIPCYLYPESAVKAIKQLINYYTR